MSRVAVYECPCCERRMNVPLAPEDRPQPRIACHGWCRRCEGGCKAVAIRSAVEAMQPPPEPVPGVLVRADVRLRRAARSLDLPARDPWDLRV